MTIIQNDIEDELVKEIKNSDLLKDVRFVHAYNGRVREVPLKGILVTVESGEVLGENTFGGVLGSGKKGEKVTSELVFTVYCPYRDGGSGITETVNAIISALDTADKNRVVSGYEVSKINFVYDYLAISRSVTLTLEYNSYGEESDE